jgi:multidrug efflux pump subunit AcrA (membrane-fusion protein)
MTIDVNIEVKRIEAAVALPASAVSLQGPPHVLAVDDDGQLTLRPVTILGRNPEWVAVEGVDAQAQVLREVRAAAPGDRIRPVASTATGPPRR